MKYSETLIQIINNATPKILAIGEEKMSLKPSIDKWSNKEILGHLIDSAMNNYRRILIAPSKEDLIFEGYDQVYWVKTNAYQSRDLVEIVSLWKALNQHIATLIHQTPVTALNKKTVIHAFDQTAMLPLQKGESSSLAYLVWDYLYHLEHHLAQLIDGYVKITEPFNA